MSGGSPPAPPSPSAEANAQIQLLNHQAQLDAAAEAKAKGEEKKALQEKIQRNREMMKRLYERSAGGIGSELKIRGFDLNDGGRDPYGIANYYLRQLNDRRAGFDPREDDPSGLFRDVNLDDIIGQFQDRERNELRAKAEKRFGTDAGYDRFNYEMDDDIIKEILGTQVEDTKAGLERSLARGQLNDNAYERALKEMDNQKQIGRSQLETMGRGVIDRYRTGLNTAVDNVYNTVGNWRFGSGLDMGKEFDRVGQIAQDYRQNLSGDVRSAFGDYNAFDLNKLVGKARNVTGYSGSGSGNANTGGNNMNNQFKDQLRTNNTQGVF
jgi:hypothetical protein